MEIKLDRPIKITQKVPDDKLMDYETIGKVIDNMIIMAGDAKKPLDKVGAEYKITFDVGCINNYSATMTILKTYVTLTISYLDTNSAEVSKRKSSKRRTLTPKERKVLKDYNAQRKKEMKANRKLREFTHHTNNKCRTPSKLTEDEVKEIYVSREPSDILGEKYGITPTMVTYIRSGKYWSHVTKDLKR